MARDSIRLARRLTERGRAADLRGETDRALEHFDDAIRILEAGPFHPLLADALRWKGTTHRERGQTQVMPPEARLVNARDHLQASRG